MLLDLQMPLKNGIAVIKETRMFFENMRKSYPNLVDPEFVFLTAFSTNAFNSYIKSLKVQYCFEKPMSALLMKRLLFLV